MKMRFGSLPLISIAATAFIALTGACSGGDNGEPSATAAPPGSSGTATATAAAGSTSKSPTPVGATPRPAETATQGGGGGLAGDVAGKLADLLSDADQVQYVVTYVTEAGVEGQTYTGTTTMYEGGDRSRVDFDVEVQGQRIQGSSITTPETNYFCTDQDGEKMCLELPAGQENNLFPDPGAQFSETVDQFSNEAGEYFINLASGRTIAGAKATCFDVDGPEGVGTVCFSDDGILLLMEMEGPDGKFKLEATEYRVGVTDEDFEPPYPVKSLGS